MIQLCCHQPGFLPSTQPNVVSVTIEYKPNFGKRLSNFRQPFSELMGRATQILFKLNEPLRTQNSPKVLLNFTSEFFARSKEGFSSSLTNWEPISSFVAWICI